MPGYSVTVQQFNGPAMVDPGYRGAGQFGYQPHVGGYVSPGVPPPAADSRDGPQYATDSTNLFAPGPIGRGQQLVDSTPPVQGNSQYSTVDTDSFQAIHVKNVFMFF